MCLDNWAWLRQAIMLVENAAGDAALLGRPRSLRGRGAVLTCLSGFIEQVRIRCTRAYAAAVISCSEKQGQLLFLHVRGNVLTCFSG